MKIRCGSHQQNRSIVRPGLSLMATKVALTAEEFRENSQRSIDLFNTEKLSTNSTHVRKKCILQFCAFLPLQSARSVWRQSLYPGDVEKVRVAICADGQRDVTPQVAICTERVEAKEPASHGGRKRIVRQALAPVAICAERVEAKRFLAVQYLRAQSCNLHGACGGKASIYQENAPVAVAICAERVEAKFVPPS